MLFQLQFPQLVRQLKMVQKNLHPELLMFVLVVVIDLGLLLVVQVLINFVVLL